MAQCTLCAKRPMAARNIRHKHSGGWERRAPRTNRFQTPNVHQRRVFIGGMTLRLNVCTRCLRTLAKQPKSKA